MKNWWKLEKMCKGHNEPIENQIVSRSKYTDKQKGFENDLEVEFVKEMISCGCIYCGDENPSRMTLDRIDNRKGHTKDNVLPSCIRCNTIRRDMPFDAWTFLIPYIEKARKRGLFGNWTGHPLHKVADKVS